MSMKIIRCPICKTNFRKRDLVVIDIINRLAHMKCVKDDTGHLLEIKDSGQFIHMLSIYEL